MALRELPTIEQYLRASGRVTLSLLVKQKMLSNVAQFAAFLRHRPVLVGASIQGATLTQRSGSEENETFMLIPHENEEDEEESGDLHRAVYPLVKDRGGKQADTFAIGRSSDNDLVMADFAISKHHALIEVKLGQYLLRDCNSTNGTLVNGERIFTKPYRLRENDIVTFARYEFVFLTPEALYQRLG